ncbi:uncharacterized protein LOC135095710 [Scylla paramamosain]|uniref:uncharacterized protein LOC135095710 n=1 Tax=Scylla paramamosain TaxID=85552 RepID=UPI003082DED1
MSGPEGGGSGGAREVHKNGWLKKMPTQERRLSVMAPFTKPAKGERVWVSFCVHDETEGWLEFYENRRSAFSHNPLQRTSLSRCLHVSPSIRVHEDNEHVFAITLEGEIIKLGAQSREQMLEWIDALRSRLRELGVLTPKDNLYSREPEGGLRSPMLRNPASPLPPTPTAFQFPPTPWSSEPASPFQPCPLCTASILCPLVIHLTPTLSPSSVVTYVRPDYPPLNRRSSFRASLPSSPTTPASSTGFPHLSALTSRPPVGAALESSGSMASSQLYGAPHTPVTPHTPDTPLGEQETPVDLYPAEPNTFHLRIGGGAVWMRVHMSHFSLPPVMYLLQPRKHHRQGCSGVGQSIEGLVGGKMLAVLPLWVQLSRRGHIREAQQEAAAEEEAAEAEAGGGGAGGGGGGGGGGGSTQGQQQQQSQYQVGQDGRLMSLREQQVIRLQREIAHQAGVRLTLRKKDCCNTVAFVNVFDHVYVAGWKQREHPYLHNTFHIGDKLVSVCGVQVTNAAEVNTIIKNEPSAMIEFIIRRVPHGKVFALKRETEGQPLGVIREGNSAEIKEIVPGGLACLHGVPPKAQTVDSLSMCSWVLTEINHRPLNLFFKHMEIADRLNAVGRDISILVQPIDLVKQLKKGLKSMKAYKDYIVM